MGRSDAQFALAIAPSFLAARLQIVFDARHHRFPHSQTQLLPRTLGFKISSTHSQFSPNSFAHAIPHWLVHAELGLMVSKVPSLRLPESASLQYYPRSHLARPRLGALFAISFIFIPRNQSLVVSAIPHSPL